MKVSRVFFLFGLLISFTVVISQSVWARGVLVNAVIPQEIQLVPKGERLNLEIIGSGLRELHSVRVLLRGQHASTVRANLKLSGSDTQRWVRISASKNAAITSGYQLEGVTKKQRIIPPVRIEVVTKINRALVPLIRTIVPEVVQLIPGGPEVKVRIQGQHLLQLKKLSVTHNGKSTSRVQTQLGKGADNRRLMLMRASRKALPGKGYRIEATIGGKSVELPMQVYVSDARDKKKLADAKGPTEEAHDSKGADDDRKHSCEKSCDLKELACIDQIQVGNSLEEQYRKECYADTSDCKKDCQDSTDPSILALVPTVEGADKEPGKLEKQRKRQERQKEADERKSKQGDTKRRKKDSNTGQGSSGTPTSRKEKKRDSKKEKQPSDVVTTQPLVMTGARAGNVPDTSTARIEPVPMPPVNTDALVMTGIRPGSVPDTSLVEIEPAPMSPVTTDTLVMTGIRAVNLPDTGGGSLQVDVPTDQGCLQPGSRTSPVALTLQTEHAFIGSALSEYAVADVDLLGHFTPRNMAGNFNSNFFNGAELLLQHAQLSPARGDLTENYQQDTVTINPVWSGGARPVLVFFDLDRVTNVNQPRYCYLVTFSLIPTSASSSRHSLDFCVGRKLRHEDWLCKPLDLASPTQAHIVSNVFTYDKYPVAAYSGYIDGEDVIRGESNGDDVPFLDLSGSDSVHFWLRGTGVVRFGEVKLFRIRLE